MSNNDFDENNPVQRGSMDQKPASQARSANWERELLEKLAFATLNEQRARRRWSIFFKLTALTLLAAALWIGSGYSTGESDPVGAHTALIEIDGTIESGTVGSADSVIPALNRAYSDENAVGVILRINSPGGSPVQAGMINDEITRLRKAYPKKPLYVVVEEMCASGGYYIAAAADKIYVNKASIVGSIGVLMDGFGVTGLMGKVGVDRRLVTAGENKGFMDPFSPVQPGQVEYARTMVNEIHQQFIDVVRKGRGKRLKET